MEDRQRGLPISEERFAELTEGLSEEARAILDRLLAAAELSEDAQLEPAEVAAGLEDLGEEEQRQLGLIASELKKAYGRRIREDEAVIDLGERATAVYERATELDDSINENSTLRDAIRVLKAHGEPVPFSEDEMGVQIEVPEVPEVSLSNEELDWVAVPESEIPTDENGIPTERAAKHGFGLAGVDGAVIKLYPLQVEAMRAIAQGHPFKKHVEDSLEDLAEAKQAYLVELQKLADAAGEGGVEMLTERYGVGTLEAAAARMVSTTTHQSYLASLAELVKEAPDARGIIDYYKGRDTKSAKRYKEWAAREGGQALVEEAMQEAIEEGAFEVVVGDDGEKYIKKGPNFEQYRREYDQEEEAVDE